MDRNALSAIAIFLLVAGILLGVNYMVSDEPDGSWLAWTVIFVGLAVLVWVWIRRQDRLAETAEHTAQETMDAAKQGMDQLDAAIRSTEETARSAVDDAREYVEDAKESAEAVAEPQGPTVEQDEVFEEEAQPAASDEPEPAADVEPLEERAEEPEPEEVVERAAEGDELAEARIAEATAAPPTDDADVEITPDDVPRQPSAPSAGEPDDLSLIDGIGPAYQKILLDAGIDTYAKLAALSEDDILKIVRDAGGRRSGTMSTWTQQAELAAKGDWDGLEKFKNDLRS